MRQFGSSKGAFVQEAAGRPRMGIRGLSVCLAAWTVLIAGGFRILDLFSLSASEPFTPARSFTSFQWPSSSSLALASPPGLTLLVFAHPLCPCTGATLDELARLTGRLPSPPFIQLVLVIAKGLGHPDASPLLARTAALPGVKIIDDPGGLEASRFGATTSGQVFLFDAARQLRYRGGVTAFRGHAGGNFGATALEEILNGEAASRSFPTFGCALFSASGSIPQVRRGIIEEAR